MYSGTTLHNYSGHILGAHQKLDRAARKALVNLGVRKNFPTIKQILYFEGKNGPDGVKSKGPARDEPWHFFNPLDPDDSKLILHIEDHYKNLVKQLKNQNMERSAFEAAWLAHAITDGLTPAHHFPYEDHLTKLRGGESHETRDTVKKKIVMPGETKKEMLKNNWKMWGAKGLFTTHGLFELGIAMIIAPLTLKDGFPNREDVLRAKKDGLREVFIRSAKEIAKLNMYDRFYKRGWTPKLAREVRKDLAPLIVKVVALAWLMAMIEAGMLNKIPGPSNANNKR
ncbi:hypothetical protein DYH10_02390 [Candidatus Saccharibacteria bacterium CPR2]|nr:hypothetical protein [Candidatus Saccharibacteria bacterium CPR2]